jgi:hypothetical protein
MQDHSSLNRIAFTAETPQFAEKIRQVEAFLRRSMAQLYSEGDWFGVRFFTARTGSRAAHIHCDDHFEWRQSDSCADRNLLESLLAAARARPRNSLRTTR